MMVFIFETDKDSHPFCKGIACTMVTLFGISEDEAIGRINRLWGKSPFLGIEDIRYHEDEAFWANDIYYGADSHWWNNPGNLIPLPFYK